MSARYIVRFDDICPTMNWGVWDQLEPVLNAHGVKPIMAVVPDNHDPKLALQAPRPGFWSTVRRWQEAGWTIALHGHQHVYSTTDAGIVGLNAYSEFAGLAMDVQRVKLQTALHIFEREGVRADAWVAPAHSFDAVTVQLLLDAGIKVISDGFHFRPIRRLGALWIPQQLWRFRSLPAGLWTVCYHHNHFDPSAIARFATEMHTYSARIVGLSTAADPDSAAEQNIVDLAFSTAWMAALRLKRRHAAT